MRGITKLAAIFLFAPLAARAADNTQRVIDNIATEAKQSYPNTPNNYIAPKKSALSQIVATTGLRWGTHPDEPYVCLKDSQNHCINCNYTTENGEPVCTKSSDSKTLGGYVMPIGTSATQGFIHAAPATANAGSLDFAGYFYRYFDKDAYIRRPDGSLPATRGAYSPAYPKICGAPTDGTLVIGGQGIVKNLNDPINAYYNFGGTGAQRDDRFRMKVAYSLHHDDYTATTDSGEATLPVYSWTKNAASGTACLKPNFAPDYATSYSDLDTEVLFDKQEHAQFTAGKTLLEYSGTKKKLPCGLVDDDVKTSQGGYLWSENDQRFKCGDRYLRVSRDSVGDPLYSRYDITMAFGNGTEDTAALKVRQCFRCATVDGSMCADFLNRLAKPICGGNMSTCDTAEKIDGLVKALNNPRLHSGLASPANEEFPTSLDCDPCKKQAERLILGAIGSL
ncbi:MAG: hypothetical protein LBL52_03595 [Rickettsiales bacterium]|jgi:hypothetical protein|nr:hypothetical protein [Rickettsiales bacterium]